MLKVNHFRTMTPRKTLSADECITASDSMDSAPVSYESHAAKSAVERLTAKSANKLKNLGDIGRLFGFYDGVDRANYT
jgi:hypothetical protein